MGSSIATASSSLSTLPSPKMMAVQSRKPPESKTTSSINDEKVENSFSSQSIAVSKSTLDNLNRIKPVVDTTSNNVKKPMSRQVLEKLIPRYIGESPTKSSNDDVKTTKALPEVLNFEPVKNVSILNMIKTNTTSIPVPNAFASKNEDISSSNYNSTY